jgi:hypothetical protein
MNKQEFIKILNQYQKQNKEHGADMEFNKGYYTILNAIVELAEQLDEPSREECRLVANEYNICSCCDYNMNNLIKDIVTGCDKDECDYDCDGAVVHQIFWTSKYMNYCPNCGAKIKKEKRDELSK